MSTDLGCCEFERRSCDIYHTHMCVHGLEAISQLLQQTKPRFPVFCYTWICMCALKVPHHVTIKHNSATVAAKRTINQSALTCPTHSCVLATAYQHKTQQSQFNLPHSFCARPWCPDLPPHTCVCAGNPSSELLRTGLTASGK